MRISTCLIPLVAGELKATCFLEKNAEFREKAKQRLQRTVTAKSESILGIGDGASLASPLSRSKACSHSHYTRPETATRQSQSGYIMHGTPGIMKVVQTKTHQGESIVRA